MRRNLGVLRHGDTSGERAPQPGVDQIYALIQRARDRGQQVELSVDGELGTLAIGVELGLTRRLIEQFAAPRPAAKPAPGVDELTPRELEVFRLLATGMTNGEIAAQLIVGETTVKTHVTRILIHSACVIAFKRSCSHTRPGSSPQAAPKDKDRRCPVTHLFSRATARRPCGDAADAAEIDDFSFACACGIAC